VMVLVVHLDAEVAWNAHRGVFAKVEVSLHLGSTGEPNDENTRQKDVRSHSSKGARAHPKKVSHSHGTGDP
jgi:hypothetical protein